MGSPFDVLSIDPDADKGEIEQAYRSRVKEVHPDQGGTAEEFRAVRDAYEAIKSGHDVNLEPDPRHRDDQPTRGESETTGSPDRASESPSRPGETESGGEAFDVEYLDYETLADRGWSLNGADLFSKAAEADLDPEAYGRIVVDPDESLLEAAERQGHAWPFACRGGACANCAVAVIEGDMGLPIDHILPEEMTDRGIRLSCLGAPVTDDTKVVFNLKHLPELDELRLPSDPFDRAHAGD